MVSWLVGRCVAWEMSGKADRRKNTCNFVNWMELKLCWPLVGTDRTTHMLKSCLRSGELRTQK